MKNNSIIIFFAIFIFVNLVYGQSGSTTTSTATPSPNAIDQCIKTNCDASSDDYLDCHANCAGVPNPNPSNIDATNACLAKCNQTNADDYKSCQDKCFAIYYTAASTIATYTASAPTVESSLQTTPSSSSPSSSPSSSSPSSPSSRPSKFLKPLFIGLGIGLDFKVRTKHPLIFKLLMKKT
ncbi:hypothetical protein Glove_309g147 [Diversispora epigaea]|uniref:Uncharacterized protein n=1 Tax=Diversispora epigaea TaxID=1348612 RepID=A0A397HY34_9GLOM|nr:hypothetical protein Glove_309g147 [Diversispora epigaea]